MFKYFYYFVVVRNWLLGNPGETCKQACSKTGRICNVEKQSYLSIEALIKEKMLEAGHVCNGVLASSVNEGALFANEQTNECGPVLGRSACEGNIAANRRRLCYCEDGT